jgi:hypothetical protein
VPPSDDGRAVRELFARAEILEGAVRSAMSGAPVPRAHYAGWTREFDVVTRTLERVAVSGAFAPGPMFHPGTGGESGPDPDYHSVNKPRPIVHRPRNFE